jgi:hypothetical protein
MWNTHTKNAFMACGLALVFGAVPVVRAQNTTHDHGSDPAHAAPQAGAPAPSPSMMADMQAAERKLDELVAKMNAAKGAEKVDRIAEVVTEMAATHKRMHAMMMGNGMMMGGRGMPAGKPGAAPETPPAAPGADHAEHHK